MRLGFLVDAKGKVPVKVVSRTFASGQLFWVILFFKFFCFTKLNYITGKTEKLVYQCLSEMGLPSGKNDTMERLDFTFEKFYTLYHKICPRNDIEELFRSM